MATMASSSAAAGSVRRKTSKRPNESLNGPSVYDFEDELATAKKLKLMDESMKPKIKREPETDVQMNAKASKKGKEDIRTDAHLNKENQNGKQVLALDWTAEDLSQLIQNLSACLPKTDAVKYNTLIEKLDWEKVRFQQYSAAECKEKWNQIMSRLRRYRTLTEMVTDAKEWLRHPWVSFSGSHKKQQKHPEMPKKPLTPYFSYFLEKREKYSREHPQHSMTDLAKLLSKKFQQLPDKKKMKYKENYEKANEIYKQELEKFKREHPEQFPPHELKLPSHHVGPDKAQTPFQLFLAEKMKKTEPATMGSVKEFQEKVRKQWSSLVDGKRIKWIWKAVNDEQRFHKEVEEYVKTHPSFKPDTAKSVLSKAEKELKDRYEGKPERPPNSGYSLFSRIMLRELKQVPSKEKMAEISRRWKLLSDHDRDSYNKQAQKANLKYKEKYLMYINSLPEEERAKLEAETKTLMNKKSKAAATETANVKNHQVVVPDKALASPLHYYQQEKLPILKQQYPEMAKHDLLRLLARDFQEMSEKKREKYKRLHEEARKAPEETVSVATKTKSSSSSSGKKKLYKGEPKKPAQSGYGLFTTEMLSSLKEVDPKQRMGEIAKRWRVMSPSEQEKYKKRAEEMMRKYQKDITKFISTLSPSDLEEYNLLRGPKNVRAAMNVKKEKVVVVKQASVKEEVNSETSDDDQDDTSDSDDSDSDDSDSDEDNSSDGSGNEASAQSGNDDDNDDDSGSGCDDSGSDSDDSDDDEQKENSSSDGSDDSDSGSGSGSGSSDDSSNSSSESEED